MQNATNNVNGIYVHSCIFFYGITISSQMSKLTLSYRMSSHRTILAWYCFASYRIVSNRIESYCRVSGRAVGAEPFTSPAVAEHVNHQRGALIGRRLTVRAWPRTRTGFLVARFDMKQIP